MNEAYKNIANIYSLGMNQFFKRSMFFENIIMVNQKFKFFFVVFLLLFIHLKYSVAYDSLLPTEIKYFLSTIRRMLNI